MRKKRIALLPFAAAVAVMGACGSSPGPAIDPTSTRFVAAPTGAVFESPVWLPAEHRLVVALIPPGKGTDAAYDHLYSLRLDGTGLRRLPLPSQHGCKLTSQSAAAALPHDGVAYLQECWGQEIPHNAKYLRTYDLVSGRVGYLRPYSLVIGANVFSVSPSGAAVINDGRGLSERLLRLTPTRAAALRLPFLRAGRPSWSPDGRSLAVDAVPQSEHASGLARLDLHRNLYLLDPSGRVRRLLVRDLVDVPAPAGWSPNGRRLAVPIQPAHGDMGLYLVNVATGAMHLLRKGDYGGATWISNRQLVAAVGVSSDLPGGHGSAGLEVLQVPRPG